MRRDEERANTLNMPSVNGGYILQPRCFDDSDAAHFPPCTREVWFYLLRNVSHSDFGKYKKGQAFFSLEDIQKALSWSVGYRSEMYSKPQITKALRRLREDTMIETAKATRGVHITICNYAKYQDPTNYEGNSEGNAKATRRQREGVHIKQEGKKEEGKKEQPPSLSEKNEVESKFELFWKEYPKKTAKKDAFKAWVKADCANGIFDTIMEKLKQFKNCDGWTKEKGKYIPLPTTWINGERWNDEIECKIEPKGQKVGGYTF